MGNYKIKRLMEDSFDIRIRSSTAKGTYKISSNGTFVNLITKVMVHETILDSEGSFKDLIVKLDKNKDLLINYFKIKYGFPPKQLNDKFASSGNQLKDLSVHL